MSRLSVLWRVVQPVPVWSGLERVYSLIGIRYGSYCVISYLIEVPNHSLTPKDTFTVYKRDLIEVEEVLTFPETILGFAHTHNDSFPQPSNADIKGISRQHIGLVICEGQFSWYDRKGTLEVNQLA